MMMHQKTATQKEAVARTWVLWDIKSCPVPSGFDARRVGPCIKRELENSGYSGSLTITAIGHLIDFPEDVLRSVSSTGISLYHIPFDVVNILDAMVKWGKDNQHPANILLITARDFSDGLDYLQWKGFNILRQILYDDSLGAFPTSTEVNSFWKSFLTDTMDSEEKSSETNECVWTCTVCVNDAGNDLVGNGFENFTSHLWNRKHRERMLGLLPSDYKLKRDEDEEEVEASLNSHPKNTTILNKELLRKAATQKEAVARTWVIWDIKSCPVPSWYNARYVGPCIKRALEKSGYSGPLIITAIGHLIDVPQDVLRSVSSTGISLYHIPFDKANIHDAMIQWANDNLPPANILLITARGFSYGLDYLQRKGFNILRKLLYDNSLDAFRTSTEVKSLWKSFLTGFLTSLRCNNLLK